MKKIVLLLTVAALSLSLSACGSKAPVTQENTDVTAGDAVTEELTEDTTEETIEE